MTAARARARAVGGSLEDVLALRRLEGGAAKLAASPYVAPR